MVWTNLVSTKFSGVSQDCVLQISNRFLCFFNSESIAKVNLIQIVVHFLNAILSYYQINILSYQIFQQNIYCLFMIIAN